MTDLSAKEIVEFNKTWKALRDEHALTVQELYEKLAVLIKEGNGDAVCTFNYRSDSKLIEKDVKIEIMPCPAELNAKYCCMNFNQ